MLRAEMGDGCHRHHRQRGHLTGIRLGGLHGGRRAKKEASDEAPFAHLPTIE